VERGKDMRKKSVLSVGVAVGLMAMSGSAHGSDPEVGAWAYSEFPVTSFANVSAVLGIATAKGSASYNRIGGTFCDGVCDPWSFNQGSETVSVSSLSDPWGSLRFGSPDGCGVGFPSCATTVEPGVGADGFVSPSQLLLSTGTGGGSRERVRCIDGSLSRCREFGYGYSCMGGSQSWTIDPNSVGVQQIQVAGRVSVVMGALPGYPIQSDPPCPHQSSVQVGARAKQTIIIQGPGVNASYIVDIRGSSNASKGASVASVDVQSPSTGSNGRITAEFSVQEDVPGENCSIGQVNYTIWINVMPGEAWTFSLQDASSGLTDLIGDVSGAGLDTCAFGCGDVGSQSDGRVDYADLRAILRSIGSSTNDCNYILSIDRNEDGFISETEALSFVCNGLADFNQDGSIDFFDFDDFMAAFDVADCAADATGDGFVDFFDLDAFLAAFESETACGDIPFC